MKFLIQRVNHASIDIEGTEIARIQKGILIFVGITHSDTQKQIDFLVNKAVGLRIFEDHNGKMNLAVQDIGGEILIVSQFTLYADWEKGNRPGFSAAAPPLISKPLFDKTIHTFNELLPGRIQAGQFGAHMHISLENDGPVTLLLER